MTQSRVAYSQNWDLDSLFPGGSSSPSFKALLQETKQQLAHLKDKLKTFSDLKIGILKFQALDGYCCEIQSFIACLLSQNANDQEALQLQSQSTQLRADCSSVGSALDALLARLDDAAWTHLISDPDLNPIAFILQERRQQVKDKLSTEQEELINQLSVDGYHGWHELYSSFMGNLRIESPFEQGESLSIEQAANRLSNPDRKIRQAWFNRLEDTWKTHEDLAAQMLNHLSGFRLNLYQARGWSSILKEPLFCNRMTESTLQSMWKAVEEHRSCLHGYFECKANLLGLEKLAWYDLEAPLPFSSNSNISFDEAAALIIQNFNAFSPAMGSFAQEAFERRWIEAEDRPGKRPGGFLVYFPHLQQTRVFMTYSGTMTNLFTLAHELGHAYHSHEVRMLPPMAQEYKMNVAETASTLAEMVLIDAMIQGAKDPQIQLELIDNKLQRSVIFLMNLHARFLFELNFYHERSKGFVLPKDFNNMMEMAQKQAYGDALTDWNPHFWVSKQHFYFTGVPFYNFPYTFGYLFSLGIYVWLKDQENRGEAYAALLRDTGRLTVEELAKRHLGVDLAEPTFWKDALKSVEKDVEDYVNLCKSKRKKEEPLRG